MDGDVVSNLSEVDVKLGMSGDRLNKAGKQRIKKGRYRNSPNWSNVCSDLSKLLGLNQILKISSTFGGFLLLWETGLALILLVLYAGAIGTMRDEERYCAVCVGITVNIISLLVFFIATTFAILDLGSKFSRADVMKGLKIVVHSVILMLQVSTFTVEFTDLVGSGEQECTIFFIFVECWVIFGNICMSEKEYAIASQQRLLADSRNRRKPQRRGERKHFYTRLHHYSIY